MGRPDHYQRLERIQESERDVLILGSEVMYAIRSGNHFITRGTDPRPYTDRTHRLPVIKYQRYWFSTRKQAENTCDRLSRLCPNIDFEVVEITL